MNTASLKQYLHDKIESTNDIEVLDNIAHILTHSTNKSSTKLWETLDTDQKEEVLLAFNESENDTDLLSFEEFFRK